MEEDYPESPLNDELQCSKVLQDQSHQSPESLTLDQEQNSSLHEDQVQEVEQNPGWDQDLSRDLVTTADLSRDRVSPQDQDQTGHPGLPDPDQDQNQNLTTPPANQEAAVEPGGSVPALVITQAEETLRPVSAPAVGPAPGPQRPQRPADLVLAETPTETGPSSDGGDMTCCDLLSPRSDSVSLASEPTASRTSEDDDSRSVAASSVMSLFHRVQLDPLEKLWWRNSALGNMAAQRQLLSQDSALVLKKTALHWAAKQGRQEAVDLMLRSGADVNIRSGYTALHLASIHGHQHVVHALINTYSAKTNIRDYHGKMAFHYWSGCDDVFNKPNSQSGSRFYRGRQTQRYVLPSLLLSRSRSQGQFSLDFGTPSQSASHDALDLQL